jgi:hypothetical protein
MTVVLTILGGMLVVAAIQDVFHTLFHPSASGDISDWIAHQVWRGFRSTMPRALSFAGPVAFVSVVIYWALSITVGFALIYLPRLPGLFTFASGLSPESYRSFWGAINVSLGSLITLSTGVYPKALWVQLLMGFESVFGFALLTASVSWILSIYPVLEHRRSLAHEATLLHFSEVNGIGHLEIMADSDLQELLLGLASQVTTSRNEVTQFPITYYFHEDERETALAGILPYIAEVAQRSVDREGAGAIAASILGGAIDDYLKVIAATFLRREFTSRREILEAFAEDHMRDVVSSPEKPMRRRD